MKYTEIRLGISERHTSQADLRAQRARGCVCSVHGTKNAWTRWCLRKSKWPDRSQPDLLWSKVSSIAYNIALEGQISRGSKGLTNEGTTFKMPAPTEWKRL